MAAVVILLSGLLIYCMARTAAVHRTMRVLDLFRSEPSADPAGMRAKAAILLGIYIVRLNAAFLVGMLVYLLTSRASVWYCGVAIVLLCWIGSLLMGSATFLRPDSTEMIHLLVADLERRRVWYAHRPDGVYLHAVDELLLRVRAARRR
jgi:hypothetical protein